MDQNSFLSPTQQCQSTEGRNEMSASNSLVLPFKNTSFALASFWRRTTYTLYRNDVLLSTGTWTYKQQSGDAAYDNNVMITTATDAMLED